VVATAKLASCSLVIDVDVDRKAQAKFEPAPGEHFTGDVMVNHALAAADGSSNVVLVRFAPGARTHWHSHAAGQYIYVVSGKGRVRSAGEPGTEPVAGDIMWVPPGETHFHGAAPDSEFVHFAYNGGGAPSWGAEVTDEEYGEGF